MIEPNIPFITEHYGSIAEMERDIQKEKDEKLARLTKESK